MAKRKNRRAGWLSWSRFLPERSTKNRETLESFVECFVSASFSGPATLRELLSRAAEAANPPFPIESLSDKLDTIRLSRGSAYFEYLGDLVDDLAGNFQNMYWWISEAGLNMAVVLLDDVLPPFDALAGELCSRAWKDGKLSITDLQTIARELDARADQIKGTFLDRFEPSARKAIKEFNQKHSKRAIKTFQQAITHPRFVRLVRKRLYRARDRFVVAQARTL